jgi:hypothetical protein
MHPSAIVERTKSPRFVFYPSPAPRINPSPVPKAIRHPTHGNWRIPNRSIFSDDFPTPIFIEIVESRSCGAHIF